MAEDAERIRPEGIRIGVIVPSVNTVVEPWYPILAPAGVSLHFARMLMPPGPSPDRIVEMDRQDGARAIAQLATVKPRALAYGCTASSIVQGHAFDAHLRDEIARASGAAATTATYSIFTACRALGMKRVTAISPYSDEIDRAEHEFFAEGGIETIAGANLGITDGLGLAKPGAEAILDLAMGAWDPDSDGLIAACLNFRSHLVIDEIEARTGKPVVTSTQAVLWHALRLAGVTAKIHGYGQLLREF
jgi:maleate isomerase